MSEVTYASIQPLIESQQVQGSSVTCVFLCPETQVRAEARGSIKRGRDMGAIAKSSVKRSLFSSLRSSVSRAVSGALGSGVAGRVGQDLSRQVMQQAQQKTSFSSGEIQAAVVDAFQRVAKQFRWDPTGERWLGAAGVGAAGAVAEAATDFEKQLQAAPIVEPYDKGVLARVLVEIAAADGQLAQEEQEFLTGFVDPSLGPVAELARKPPLSAVEIEETSAGPVRETMFMLALALAYSDKDMSQQEMDRLRGLGAKLGVSTERMRELIRYAQLFLYEKALERAYMLGSRDEQAFQEAQGLAQGVGLDATAAERVDVRYRKRLGIV